MNAMVEHIQHQLDHFGADARTALRKGVCADKQHGARGFFVDFFANAHCMAADEVALKLTDLVWWDDLVLKMPKARGDAVSDAAFSNEAFHRSPRSLDLGQGAFFECYALALCHSNHIIDTQRFSRYQQGFHLPFFLSGLELGCSRC